jgi:hypothetical protein
VFDWFLKNEDLFHDAEMQLLQLVTVYFQWIRWMQVSVYCCLRIGRLRYQKVQLELTASVFMSIIHSTR